MAANYGSQIHHWRKSILFPCLILVLFSCSSEVDTTEWVSTLTSELEPLEIAATEVTNAQFEQFVHKTHYVTDAEKKSLVFRRSLYISEDVLMGTVLSPENLRCVRPGLGLAPKYYDQVIGRKLNRDVNKGTPLTWNLLLGEY